MDETIQQAISAFNQREYNPFVYEELGRTLDDEHGGVVYLAPVSRETGERYPGVVEWLVVVPRAGVWQALLPGEPGYRAAVESLPPEVLARLNDSRYRLQADPRLVSSAEIAGYQLPWEDGRWATVTRSFREHGRGRADFDVSGGGTITAAKAGRILYANDRNTANTYGTGAWWHWNTIIIQHGEHEYSLYGHLAPGSIPAWIDDACDDDYSQPNCDLPVQAGDVIALEGNTGYSSSPHLHVEFGQGFGVIGYATAPGAITYAGYIYAEHNVGFSGYAPPEVAGWRYGQLVQAAHHPAPLNAELVQNGSFDDGTTAWTPSGQVNWSVQDGVMRFLRLNTSEPPPWASFYQDLGVGAPANAVFEVRFSLGNASTYPKTVAVTLSNAEGRDYGALTCEYVVPANAPLQPYVMRAQPGDTWANVRLEFGVNPPDSLPAALVDGVTARLIPSRAANDTECDLAAES
jgi:murein DD-endopeptidase MepM/ murein hydrolase activator NlpD